MSSNDVDYNVGSDATNALLKFTCPGVAPNLTTFPNHGLQYAMQSIPLTSVLLTPISPAFSTAVTVSPIVTSPPIAS